MNPWKVTEPSFIKVNKKRIWYGDCMTSKTTSNFCSKCTHTYTYTQPKEMQDKRLNGSNHLWFDAHILSVAMIGARHSTCFFTVPWNLRVYSAPGTRTCTYRHPRIHKPIGTYDRIRLGWLTLGNVENRSKLESNAWKKQNNCKLNVEVITRKQVVNKIRLPNFFAGPKI